MNISLCLIVKNEEKVLRRCLDSMQFYDELVIVDTGSKDKTVDIALGYTDNVFDFKWIDDFGAARNYAFEKATGDILVWVDADDILIDKDAQKFRELLLETFEDRAINGLDCPYIYSHESTGTGEMPEFKYHRLRAIRKGTGFWRARVHEYIDFYDGLERRRKSDAVVFHHYREEGKGKQNTARNLRILKKVVDEATPEEKPRYLFYLGKEYTYNNKYEEAIEIFKQYLNVSNWIPEKHRAMYEMAVCYQMLGQKYEAKKYALEAIAINEDYCDPYVLLGIMAYNEARWQDVIKWMTAATQVQAPEVLFFDFIPYSTYVPYDYMSIAYWQLGDKRKGLQCVKKCLEYKPKDERFNFNLDQFKSSLSGDN